MKRKLVIEKSPILKSQISPKKSFLCALETWVQELHGIGGRMKSILFNNNNNNDDNIENNNNNNKSNNAKMNNENKSNI